MDAHRITGAARHAAPQLQQGVVERFRSDPESIVAGHRLSPVEVLQQHGQLVRPNVRQAVDLLQAQPELTVQRAKAALVVLPVAEEVHRTVRTPLDHGPTSSLVLLVAEHRHRLPERELRIDPVDAGRARWNISAGCAERHQWIAARLARDSNRGRGRLHLELREELHHFSQLPHGVVCVDVVSGLHLGIERIVRFFRGGRVVPYLVVADRLYPTVVVFRNGFVNARLTSRSLLWYRSRASRILVLRSVTESIAYRTPQTMNISPTL
uniref:Uncharacterized protein n=1 Tax=Anopheles atroparvus TaxID=41427 RepID=A0A182IP18_ANOAO